jgi:hypothetical protein
MIGRLFGICNSGSNNKRPQSTSGQHFLTFPKVHQIRTVLFKTVATQLQPSPRKAAEEQKPAGRELLKFVQDNGGAGSSASGVKWND